MRCAAVTAKWAANKDLVRKQFLWGVGEAAGTGAGVYVWPSIEAAEKAHSDEWREAVKKRTGGYPTDPLFRSCSPKSTMPQGSVTEWSADGKARELQNT